MKTYKGYSVPDVGKFVSESKSTTDITRDYCDKGRESNCGDCYECLFFNEYNTLDWHEARLNNLTNKGAEG